MTTKEFIKMLQEADPSGECHVRMPGGGIPYAAELKPGYWDGPYSYINEEGQYVHSTQGNKVDIHAQEVDDFVERNYRGKTWENIEKLFVFDLTYLVKEHREERENRILKEAKETFIDIEEIQKKLYNKSLSEMIENSNSGWTWFQDKRVDLNERPNLHIYYTWKIYNKWGKDQGSNLHQTEPILKSGLWEKHDNGVKKGYYQWIKK